MVNSKKITEKYIFLGDINSVNIEIICKAFPKLKNKTKYIVVGNIKEVNKYIKKINFNLKINEIFDPFNFTECDKERLNIFNIKNISSKKYMNLMNQIKILNFLCNKTKKDLITMPINKNIFKKQNINFIGMTEYLAKINKTNTLMLMYGDKLSVIPFTTHINLKDIHKKIKSNTVNNFLKLLLKLIKENSKVIKFKEIIFLCYNPHCGENGTLGIEDKILRKIINKFNKVKGPYPADSAFNNFKSNTLFISTYHDQGLIPFKALNNKAINFTLGLDYRRFSPAHGTAIDIKFKNLADISSYLRCMEI